MDKEQISIHPDKRRPVQNTSKPHKGGGKLAKRMKRLSDRRLAHSATLKSLPGKTNPAAFKMPGSMNGRT